MRKLITAFFFLAAAYFAVYMGDYSYGYIANGMNGWGSPGPNTLAVGPGWFGALAAIIGVIGVLNCGILIMRSADDVDNLSEFDLVGHGFGLLMAAWAFGALTGPFAAWGMAPHMWLKSRLAFFAILCAWPFVYEGLFDIVAISLKKLRKSPQFDGDIVRFTKSGQKNA